MKITLTEVRKAMGISEDRSNYVGIVIMLLSARAFAETGLSEYKKMVGAYVPKVDAGEQPEFKDLMRHGIPSAVNLAFAVELFLKLILWQRKGAYPRGHNLKAISKTLPNGVLKRLRKAYAEEYAKHSGEAATTSGLRIAQFNFSGINRTGITKPPSTTFDLAMEDIQDAFVLWRYLFEKSPISDGLTVDLKALVILPQLLHDRFLEYQDGNLKFNTDGL